MKQDWRSNLVCGIATTVAASALAALTVDYPAALLAVPAALLFYGLRFPAVRVLWVVFGGLLVLQSSQGLNATKLGYFAGVVVAAMTSYPGAMRTLRSRWGRPGRPMLAAVVVLLLLSALAATVSFLISRVPGTDIARDALTYVLPFPAVLVALDAAGRFSRAAVERLIMVVTALSAVGFAVAWLGRRGTTGITTNQFILASVMLLAPGVALGIVRSVSAGQRGRLLWLTLPAIAIGSVLVTGSRSGLVLVAAFVGVLGSSRKARVPILRLAPGIAVIGGLTWLALTVAASALGLNDFLSQRLVVAQEAVNNGWAADQSGAIRLHAQAITLGIWRAHYWLGIGLGQQFPDPGGPGTVSFQVDSPYTFLAKFGLIGTALVAVAIALIARRAVGPIAADAGEEVRTPEQAVLRGTIAIWLATLIFGAFTEDKGWALSLPLLVLLLLVPLRERVADSARVEIEAPARSSPSGVKGSRL